MSSKKPKMSKDKSIETLKRVLDYIAAYRWAVCLSLLLALVTVAFTLYIPILTGKAVDEIVSQGNVDFAALINIIKKIIMAMAATAISQWLMNHINNIITYRVVKDIRTKAFGHLEVLPLSYIDSHPSGDIISRIIADIDQFSEGLLMCFTQFFTGVMTILGTLLFMVSINPLITLVVVVLTPISLFVASFIAKKTYVMFKHQSETRGELTTLTDEMLGNMKVVQAFGYQKEAEERERKANLKTIPLSKLEVGGIYKSTQGEMYLYLGKKKVIFEDFDYGNTDIKEGHCFAYVYNSDYESDEKILERALEINTYRRSHSISVLKGNKKLTDIVRKVDLKFPLIKEEKQEGNWRNHGNNMKLTIE